MPSKRRGSSLCMSGHHIAIRVPDFEASRRWFVETLDFRVHKVWTFKNRKHAYLTPPTEETLHIEILGGAPVMRPETRPARSYVDLKDSLRDPGYHHFCLIVEDIDKTIAELQRRGVTIVEKPFDLKAIQCRLAFFADPWGNLIELAQVIPLKAQPKLNKRPRILRSG
jgi:glyoxylase I family protein